MKRLYKYISFAVISSLLIAACNKMEDDFPYGEFEKSDFISPLCMFENSALTSYASDKLVTKSLINQTTTTDTILCNFLRLDEQSSGGTNKWSFPGETGKYSTDWKLAYLSEGSIATVPNSQNGQLRSVALHPEQPYISVPDTAISRMIGWYPRTCDVPSNAQGTDASIQFQSYTSTQYLWETNSNEGKKYHIGVKFTGLDGSKDVMVSDVRDGSYQNKFQTTVDTKNYFTFKHYLSAVRIYAKAERSSQDISMWGEINEVIIMRQPTSCTVELPQIPNSVCSDSTGFGSLVVWGDENAKFPIQKGYIFGEKDADNPKNTPPVEYPIDLSGNSIETYLGYSLIQPNCTLRIQVHTNAGVYDVEVPPLFNETAIFKEGYIYNLLLDFKTDGSIFTFLENEGSEKYFDLTKGEEYKIDSDGNGNTNDETGETLFKNKFANCYIVYSDPTGTEQQNGSSTYDGFSFDASIIGNGKDGIISSGAQTLYPVNEHIDPKSADILWETTPRLITQVELLFDHVRFKVAKDSNGKFKEGNAVIAVYDENKTILWSWHIWITDKPNGFTYTENDTTITIMDRNLGATFGGIPTSAAYALESYGLYYQWGRKDPSMGPPRWDYSPINMTTAPYFDYSTDEKNESEVVRFATPTLQNAVENPQFIIMPTTLTQTYNFNWLYEKIDFLWGYNTQSGNTHKTIYDPCPHGYRVPGGEVADVFSVSGAAIDVTSPYGQKVTVNGNSLFFPYSGFKGVDRGLNSLVASWKYVGKKGDYQSSIVCRYQDKPNYYMHRSRTYISKEFSWNELNVEGTYQGHQIYDYTNRRTAAPVRCVKDENHSRISAFVIPVRNYITSPDTLTVKVFAESFGEEIESASLYLAYHKESDSASNDPEGEHNETLIKNFSLNEYASGGKILNTSYRVDFSKYFKVNSEDTRNLPQLSDVIGNLRLILRVKNQNNINRIASAVINIQTVDSNNIDMSVDTWDNLSVFENEPINKIIRVYGDIEPERVEMFKDNEVTGIDITAYRNDNTGSVYKYDYDYSTAGLLLYENNDKNAETEIHTVTFKVTFTNDQTITKTQNITVKKAAAGPTFELLTSSSNIDLNAKYVITPDNSSNTPTTFVYDAGDQMGVKTIFDNDVLFTLSLSDGKYRLCNVQTGHYVSITTSSNSATLFLRTTYSSWSSAFTITPTNDYATLHYNNNNTLFYWSWQENESVFVGADKVSNSNQISDKHKWRIYKLVEN